ncbi:septum formation initiator family protein [Streptomyces sp. NPDC046215]|uniref:septum formation initiator family protein n=1 Tax=Streptomyces sp. NPDC046215 TaxID=3155774 RepID=UPI0033D0AB98
MTAAARGRDSRSARLSRLRVPGTAGAKRTPFVLLVVVLLGSGLISLLLLNSSLNQGSFELSRLQRKTTELTDEQQALQQEVDRLAAPDALANRARQLGMVPGGTPAFLSPDGTVRGSPAPALPEGVDPAAYTVPEPAPVPAPEPSAAPEAAGPAVIRPAAPLPGVAPVPPAPTAKKSAPTTGR